ncbi:dihydrofolate reductase family protein [Pedobacter punctiformis]|uniref:Dihydrofolate reductase family protein n=1 Tax=Pedobacter punctiformis TaxID=3004097 RepID=A0ABT4LC93_9SPHI|nr:dihydrofolate reductase family protein [Pedobacter sp. HCMS5-2]MCZ4245524.1 dihydrofolate reductase family protein [Pedobacter sp. HCMS5-2]
MRKLKLQIQTSIDGFVSGTLGEMDWVMGDWCADLNQFAKDLTDPVDTIILGRNLAEKLIPEWIKTANRRKKDDFAKKMANTTKIVFSRNPDQSLWENTSTANNLVEEIKMLKQASGGDMIVYGGGQFVSALIENGLLDEIHLFVNPAVLGRGKTIFKNKACLSLIGTYTFNCGIVVLTYEPLRNE